MDIMKNIYLKLLLVMLLAISLISCGEKDNISKSNSNNTNNENQNSIKKEDNDTNQNTKSPELFKVAGGTNKVSGVCEYYFSDIIITKKIKPLDYTGEFYYSNLKNKDNIYLDVIFNTINLNNEDKKAEDIITAKIKFKDKEYSSFSLVESVDGSSLKENDLIKSQEQRTIHYAFEVPNIDVNSGELQVILTINGKEFTNKFQLESEEKQLEEVSEGLTEDEYYKIIKDAMEKEQDYINSIEDPNIKQSVQSARSAAIAESSGLYIKYPSDTKTIDAALKRVLDGE